MKGEASMTKPMSRFNVEVTDKDIERAKQNDSYRCVVAQAVARTIPDATRIEVDTQSIRFTRDGARFIYLTPYAVQGYVIAFDAGESIEPFSFQLRNPQRVARRVRTETGLAAVRAADRARVAASAGDRSAPVKGGAESPRRKPSRKASPKDDARAAYAAVAAGRTEPMTVTTGDGPRPRRSPPRLFKGKQRSYGHRLLRINQNVIDGE